MKILVVAATSMEMEPVRQALLPGNGGEIVVLNAVLTRPEQSPREVFRRPSGRRENLRNTWYISFFCNAAGRDAWAH